MRLLRNNSLAMMCLLGALVVTTMAGCSLFGGGSKAPPIDEAAPPDMLQIGDKIRVEISGTPDRIDPTETDVHADGSINLPYVGRIAALGKTPTQLEKDITDAYVPAYFPHVGVSVTVSARFFYVGGQVVGAGSTMRILYTGPTTVLRAIQAAGDFTPFANKRNVQVTRAVSGKIYHENCTKALKGEERDLPVYPNDIVYVGRRGI